MRIRWKRFTWFLAAAIPLAALVGVIWASTRDLSPYQGRLAEQVRRVSGRTLSAKVPLAVKLSREPAMVAEGVTLSNPPWTSRPDLARVRKVTLYLDPVSLLLGELRIGRLVLDGADILVEQNEVGDTNLEMLPPLDGSGPHAGENRSFRLHTTPTFPWIGTIEVHDSVATIAGGAGHPSVVVEIPNATFRSAAPNQPLQIEGRFAVPKGTPLELAGTAGSFEGWMKSLPGNIDLQANFGGGKVAIKGTVGVKGTALQVNAEGPDLSVFAPYVRLPLPAGGPYALAAKAATQRSAFKVEVASLKVGRSQATGDALFRTDRKGTASVAIDADVSHLDLSELHAPPSAAAEKPPAQPRLVPSLPFAARWLGRSKLSLSAQFGEVLGLGSSKMQNASLSLTSSENRFAFRANATIGGGSAAVDLAYDPAGRAGVATLAASASRLPVGDIGAVLGFDWGARNALADIDLHLHGSGRSTRDALNGASGSLDVSIAKGSWPRDWFTSWPAETQQLLAPAEPTAFNCVAGHFDVTGGVGFLRRMVVDTPRAVLIGGGYVQLRSEGWEFLFAPEARDRHDAPLTSPVRLQGSSSRITASALDPAMSRLLVPAGAVASIAGQLSQAARQSGANPCSVVASKLDSLRPGLRAQLPLPPTDRRRTPHPQHHSPAHTHGRGH